MQRKPADERVRRYGFLFGLAVLFAVSPGEGRVSVFDIDNSIVGDGDAVDVSSQIVEDMPGAFERLFGIYTQFLSYSGEQNPLNSSFSAGCRISPENESQKCLLDRPEQDMTDHLFVSRNQRIELVWQGEDVVEIAHRQEFRFAGLLLSRLGRGPALGATCFILH